MNDCLIGYCNGVLTLDSSVIDSILVIFIQGKNYNNIVDVPEWLSGMTRNHVGFARAGSNPAVHGFKFLLHETSFC